MRIWLVTIGEPLPVGGDDIRLLRTGLLAEALVDRGHKVLWWTSTFLHSKKQKLYHNDTKIRLSDLFCLFLLDSLGYKKNISIKRIIDHIGLSIKFKRYSRNEERPDIILCSLPTLELSVATTSYGVSNNIPVILDLRDMWPDIFVSRAPRPYQQMLRLIFSFWFYQARKACRNATALTGITSGFVEWGLRYANRNATSLDRDFPMGYSGKSLDKVNIELAVDFWNKHGINSKNNEFIVCLFSNIVKQFALETVIDVARKLENSGRLFRFVLCGNGDALEYFKSLAAGCDTVLFPGWVSKSQIWTLMRIASVGLAPYRSTEDFVISIPNKIIEYMSAGLPVISSLEGTVEDLLLRYNAGITYQSDDHEGLFRVLCECYDNTSKLKDMSKNAYDIFKQRFVAEKVYSNMCDYLEKVAAVSSRIGIKEVEAE